MIFAEPKRIFITGGAGALVSAAVELLLPSEHQITICDPLCQGVPAWLTPLLEAQNVQLIQADPHDLAELRVALTGHDLVWHLDTPDDLFGGYSDSAVDPLDALRATHTLLEAIRLCKVAELLFVSSAAVYGNIAQMPTSEDAGPLLPVSLYGAQKLAAEGFISAYCQLFGLHAWMFRLDAVVGGRAQQSIVAEIARQLRRQPDQIEVFGDGKQRHNYLLAEECIAGMLHAYRHAPLDPRQPCAIFNLGATQSAGMMTVVDTVLRELGQRDTGIALTGGAQGWPGEQTRVQLDVSKLAELGWSAQHSSTQAIRRATRRLLDALDEQPVAQAQITVEVC